MMWHNDLCCKQINKALTAPCPGWVVPKFHLTHLMFCLIQLLRNVGAVSFTGLTGSDPYILKDKDKDDF